MNRLLAFLIVFLLYFVCPLRANETSPPISKTDPIYGPIKINDSDDALFFFERSPSHSIKFIYSHDGQIKKDREIIDEYHMEGGIPEIETVFSFPVRDKENIFVMISWEVNHRADGIYGTDYRIFVYEKSLDKKNLKINPLLKYDKNLEGFEGTDNWEESNYELKTPQQIKDYIKNTYN